MATGLRRIENLSDEECEPPPLQASPSVGSLAFVAASLGQTHTFDSAKLLSEVVRAFEKDPGAIGVIVTDADRFIGVLSREHLARFLSKQYTQFLFLHKPLSHVLATWMCPALECPGHMVVSEAIALALARPVEQRYEPVVVCGGDGVRRLVDIHGLLVQQNRMLESTLSSLEQQRALTARVEHEREDLQTQLLDASRNAGRAEVATGILHNVGNVLNSVSVSRAMISRKLEQSKVARLSQAACLLHEHRTDLAAFLTSDERGQALPGYMAKLADVLSTEHAFMVHEMKELGENLEHIKQVVATQQSYARAGAVVQKVRPVDLMDDAVRMNIMSFDRHNVTVERRYEDTGTAPMDRHRVLQILINLISNAKNAVKSNSGADRTVVLTVRRCRKSQADRVEFIVEDNGVGISRENLTRIFAHGFTTRRNGHGFGLHSSANCAKELGGTLRAESEGAGRGSRFILDLPVAKPSIEGAA